MTTGVPSGERRGGFARHRADFRAWRRVRPFWGGLLTLLAGLEIFATTQGSLGGLSFQMGPTGFLSWLLPAILVTCGLLLWFSPQQRIFYGVVAAVTAVFSLIGVNLGGFLVGTLLGMFGSALGFAWAPVADDPAKPDAEPDAADAPVDPAPQASMDDLLTDGTRSTPEPVATTAIRRSTMDSAGGDGGPEPGAARRGPGMLVVPLLVLSLSAVGLVTVRTAEPAGAAPCRPAPTATREAAPTGDPTGTPAASPSGSPAPDPVGGLIDSIVDGVNDLLGIGDPTPPAATPGPGATGSPAPTAPPRPPAGCDVEPTGSAKPRPLKRLKAAPGQPAVAVHSLLTGTKLTMKDLKIQGVTTLPTADGGTVKVLKFSMSKAVTEGFELTSPLGGGPTLLTRSAALTIEDDVVFYASGFSGRVTSISLGLDLPLPLPIPLTMTPEAALLPDGFPLALPGIVFDRVRIELVFVDCGKLSVAPNLTQTSRRT